MSSDLLWGKNGSPPFYRVMIAQNRGVTLVIDEDQFVNLNEWIKKGVPFLVEQQNKKEGVYLTVNPRAGGLIVQVAVCLQDQSKAFFLAPDAPVSGQPRPTLTALPDWSDQPGAVLERWEDGAKQILPMVLEKLEALDKAFHRFLTDDPPPPKE